MHVKLILFHGCGGSPFHKIQIQITIMSPKSRDVDMYWHDVLYCMSKVHAVVVKNTDIAN